MRGMNRDTGLALDGNAHVLQSVRDIITTPVGSRVMLREYGCKAPLLVDRPMNTLFDVELHSSIAEALERWEPRFKLSYVRIEGRSAQGRVIIGIAGTIVATGETARIEGLTL